MATFAATIKFSDVAENMWYTNAVERLSQKGIITGYADGTFGPNKNVNRAELAVMLDRLIQYTETGTVAPVIPAGWATLSTPEFNFTISYPSDWIVDNQSANHISDQYVMIDPPNPEPFTQYI
ncbi:hypothetical protein COV81_00790 [Candidatus Peregrinibacteria bacterium CG11_big_fil_rev_8_21_14_0_20_41_10]|nr:MAG: hypothetical protein COV81_00790 [Candidatus Peregrinibacteria bacterium CG11_big_fil_rev_8_21_14_0_20_41_10]PJC38043.1 MAG: hypothetical protein CO045_02405 [Candidatus Peregrinibacteria bacterium CG_4_9_14_0_2_um_filter_41_14]